MQAEHSRLQKEARRIKKKKELKEKELSKMIIRGMKEKEHMCMSETGDQQMLKVIVSNAKR
jgi:predicted regulator of Ras-like GTPase activity (Roadblock/LC7/MglB family)